MANCCSHNTPRSRIWTLRQNYTQHLKLLSYFSSIHFHFQFTDSTDKERAKKAGLTQRVNKIFINTQNEETCVWISMERVTKRQFEQAKKGRRTRKDGIENRERDGFGGALTKSSGDLSLEHAMRDGIEVYQAWAFSAYYLFNWSDTEKSWGNCRESFVAKVRHRGRL